MGRNARRLLLHRTAHACRCTADRLNLAAQPPNSIRGWSGGGSSARCPVRARPESAVASARRLATSGEGRKSYRTGLARRGREALETGNPAWFQGNSFFLAIVGTDGRTEGPEPCRLPHAAWPSLSVCPRFPASDEDDDAAAAAAAAVSSLEPGTFGESALRLQLASDLASFRD